MKQKIHISLLLLCAIVSLAVSCPGPTPDPPEPIDPIEVKSAERKSFESSSDIGLYIKGICALSYDKDDYQQAFNSQRRTYRIQSDDQNRYMHILFSGTMPDLVGEEVVCTITYRLAESEETIMIVKFTVLKVENGKLWLWNELQKSGVITPSMP